MNTVQRIQFKIANQTDPEFRSVLLPIGEALALLKVAEAARVIFAHLDERSVHSLPGNLTIEQALHKVAAFNVEAEDLLAMHTAVAALDAGGE